MTTPATIVLESEGTCPTCDQRARFVAYDPWLRDNLLCSACGSLPRERALMLTIERYMPDWRDRVIHESSPALRGASVKLATARGYAGSQYYEHLERGAMGPEGYRSEDLERLTLADESVDLFVTQDVLEHIFDADRVFAEIGRVLKPGGMHVFTVPLLRSSGPTFCSARRLPNGSVQHVVPPEYHGNPVDPNGSLVTFHWGYDIVQHIFRASGLVSTIVFIDDLSRGIRAELNEVIVSAKIQASAR